MNQTHHLNFLDRLLTEVNNGINTLLGVSTGTRAYPASTVADDNLSSAEKRLSQACMRVNHSGEVCAQALYRGQALTAQSAQVKETLYHCADEETDHLRWCAMRLDELGGHTSYLNAFWYGQSFLIGLVAGFAGDGYNLGFVEETEKQVAKHLTGHLQKLPENDCRSRAIVEQMRVDEIKHGATAQEAGARELPSYVKKLMSLQARIMTTVAFYI